MSLYQSMGLLSTQQGFVFATGDVTPADEDVTVTTGLSTVSFCGVSLREPPTINHTISICNADAVAGDIRIRSFKPTAAGDTTPVSSTTEVKVTWWAVGTL